MIVAEAELAAPPPVGIPHPPRRRRRRWPAALVISLAAGCWLAWCGWSIVAAHDDVQAGRRLVRGLQHGSYDELLDGGDREELAAARAHFAAASDRLTHPGLGPLRVLPVVGRQLDSVTSMSTSVEEVLVAGTSALGDLDRTRDEVLDAGAGRPAALHRVSQVAGDLADRLRPLDLGPDSHLIGRLADAREELAGDLEELITVADRTEAVAGSLAAVLDGPGRWLLLASNSSQMQNGSGMFLSYSVMEVEDGRISLGDVHQTSDLVPAERVDLDADHAALWPWMDPNRDFRHLGTSARFDATARTASDLLAAAGHGPVDGVLAVDPFALQSLLAITGPVGVEGGTVTADGVVEDLLHEQYAVFADDRRTDDIQADRRDRLGEVARAVMEALDTTDDIDVEDVELLAAAARARHLMAWSSDPSSQEGFRIAGIDGTVPADGLLLSVVNRGGNKLDWFLDIETTMSVTSRAGGDEVEIRARLVNSVEDGEPTYVAGPYPGSGLRRGQHLGVLTLTAPAYARDLRVEGEDALVRGRDGSHQVVGVPVLVDPGAETTVVVRFGLPAGVHELQVVPAARPHPTRWTLHEAQGGQIGRWDDAAPRRVRWAP